MIALSQYQQAAAYIAAALPYGVPDVAVVLGSGLGALADEMTDRTALPYGDIPGFAAPTVASHAGVLYEGLLGQRRVILMSGRSHYYEGHSFEQVCFAVRVLHLCGVKTLILTNAAGGVNTAFRVGDLMILSDHIKLVADSPCRGALPDCFGPQFPDMSQVYDASLRRLAADVMARQGLAVREGVYFYMSARNSKRLPRSAPSAFWAAMRWECPPWRRPLRRAPVICGCWASPASPTPPQAWWRGSPSPMPRWSKRRGAWAPISAPLSPKS